MRFFVRFVLLAIGFSLFTYGLLEWASDNFALTDLLPFSAGYRTQGLHYLMLGLAMIPPSLWEIFNLERQARLAQPDATPGNEDSGAKRDD